MTPASSPYRLVVSMLCVVAAAAVPLVTCSDWDNNNPGVSAMTMDGSMDMDGSMNMDGSMDMDGGMGDMGGMGGTIEVPAGPAVFAMSTALGKEGLWVVDHETHKLTTLPLKEFRVHGLMTLGVDPGLPATIEEDATRKYHRILISTPPRVLLYEVLGGQEVWAELIMGAIADQPGRLTSTADRKTLYATNTTGNRLVRINVDTKAITQSLTATDVPEMQGPAGVAVGPDGKLYVGSSQTTQTKFLVFEDTGSLQRRAALDVTLSDGSVQGSAPGRCVVVPGKSFLYCGSARQGGSGGIVWKLSAGTPPKAVVTTLSSPPGVFAASPGGERLYVADGATLRAYWVKEAASEDAPSPVGAFSVGGPIEGIAPATDGMFVYVSSSGANVLAKLRTFDLSEVVRFTNMDKPGPIAFSPKVP